MANNNMSMDERMSKHEREFATRFSCAITQMADEGIELSLPIVVIEHIHKAENNLSVVRSQVRKCAKEDIPKKFEEDENKRSSSKGHIEGSRNREEGVDDDPPM